MVVLLSQFVYKLAKNVSNGINLGNLKYNNAEIWFKFDPTYWDKDMQQRPSMPS
jgi:hypothetical protein